MAEGLGLPLSTLFDAMEVGEPAIADIEELALLLRSSPDFPVSALTAFIRALLEFMHRSDDD